MSPPLVLLLALAPQPCAPADLACVAREKALEAKQTTDPRDRAHALLTAARAHLALFRKTGEPAELCTARRLVPHRHTSDLGDLPRATRTEVDVELARLQHRCTPPRPSPATAPAEPPQPLIQPAAPSPTDTTSGDPSTADAALLEVDRRPDEVVRPVVVEGPTAPTMPAASTSATPSSAPVERRPRPGRGLLLAGGLNLAAASALAGTTAYAAIRVRWALAEHDGLAATANAEGYTPPDVGATRRGLEAEAQHWRRVMLGTSIATGVVTGAAIALLAAGGARRRSGRLALHPILPGLLLTARF